MESQPIAANVFVRRRHSCPAASNHCR